MEKKSLKQRILDEMLVDYDDILEEYFDSARTLFNLQKDGTVEVLDIEHMSNRDKIVKYLIGKLYSTKSELCQSFNVGYQELEDNLMIPKGSLMSSLKKLRDTKVIKSAKEDGLSLHFITPNEASKYLATTL